VWASHHWSIQFSVAVIERVFTAKFPFLGLVLTAGTFQYKIWTEIVARDHDALANPEWTRFEAETEALVANHPQEQPKPDALRHREAAVAAWKAYRTEVAERQLRFIGPHNLAILGNFIFIGAAILFSVAADVGLFLSGNNEILWLQQSSTALLVVTIFPFLENIARYVISLFGEFLWAHVFFSQSRP
jgi:hypothetical protein